MFIKDSVLFADKSLDHCTTSTVRLRCTNLTRTVRVKNLTCVLCVISAAVQSRRDVLPLVRSVQLRLAAGGGAVPADSAAPHLYSDQEVLLDLRHHRLGYVLMSHGLCSSVLVFTGLV